MPSATPSIRGQVPETSVARLGIRVLPLALALIAGLPSSGIAYVDCTWTQISAPSPPPPRRSHTAIYDPVRDRMLVFGGYGGDNSVWALSFSEPPSWTQLPSAGTPPSARHYHTAIYDPVRDRMVLFGGETNGVVAFLNDVWALTLSGTPTWSQLSPGGTPPPGLHVHTAIYDPVRDRMVVFGGFDGTAGVNDAWALSLGGSPAWSQLSPTGPLPSSRWAHTAVYDPVRDRMLVFGGAHWEQSVIALNDLWAMSLSDPPAWSEVASSGTLPTPRLYHTAIYDPVRDLMLVFGGYADDPPIYFPNETCALTLSGIPTWSEHTPGGTAPTGRQFHTAVYDGARDRMVVFGGADGGSNDTWAQTPEWLPLFPESQGLSGAPGHGTGAAWVDLDGDGDLDCYVLKTQGEADLVYENQGAGVFVADSEFAPLNDPGNGQGMDWGDYDNDGDLDLYLVNASSPNKLFRNDGGGSFVDVTTPPLNYGCCDDGAAWVDYDRDGRLDLYLTTVSGQPNHLYRNVGGGIFVEATPPALAITSDCATSAWGDYDGDGDSDAFVAVADGPDHLVRNDGGGSFTDITTPPLNDAGVAEGAAWGDYDNDGDLDLYLCNFGQPNRLFRNDGSVFVDVATGPLADANQSQSGTWADFDNDGDLDLVVTNFGQPSSVLRNDGGNSFVPFSTVGDTTKSLGAAWGDYDQDGDEDLFVANFGTPDKLFRNDVVCGNNWLEITLQGTTSNRAAIGTRIIAWDFASGTGQMREHGSNHGFWSCNAPAEHFGLGTWAQVDAIFVRWPSGLLQSFEHVSANQRITFVEGSGLVGVQPELSAESLAVRVRPNPFRQGTEILCSGVRTGPGVVKIFDVQGRLLRTLAGQVPGAIPWNGRDAGGRAVSNGIYFYRLTAGERTLTGKVVRIR